MKKIKPYWPLLVIVLISTILRFWTIEATSTFGGDLGYDLLNVKQILEGDFTLLGPRIGLYNDVSALYLGPFYYYLIAPFLWLTKLDPIGVSYGAIIARTVTTVLIYLIVKKRFNVKTAVISAIISSISPYWVNYLGFPSNPYFLLPTVSLIIYLLANVNKNLAFKLISVGFLTGIATQFHYVALIILPAIIICFSAEKKNRVKKITNIILGFTVAIFPMILFELRNQFFLTGQILKQLAAGSFNPNPALLAQNLKTSFEYMAFDTFGLAIAAPIVLLCLAYWMFAQGKQAHSQNNLVYYFITIVFFLNVLVAVIYPGDVQPHYLAITYPGLFIFVSFAIAKLERLNKYLFVALIIIISINLFFKNNFFSSSGYTMPEDLRLSEIRQISKIIADDTRDESFNIVSMLDGDSRAQPYRYLVEVYGKNPQSVENYDKQQSLYIITRDPTTSITESNLFEISSFQPSHVVKKWEIRGNIRLIKLSKSEETSIRQKKIITLVNLVRSRDLWFDKSLENLKEQIEIIDENNLKATWLLQYDTFLDEELVDIFKSLNQNHEIGIFMEVSEKQATDSDVSYRVAQGDYYQPNKVFLQGYDFTDRKKLIKSALGRFTQTFKKQPISAGAWYIDSVSQEFLYENGISALLTVSDQFDTDGASVWGKYFSMPFYPSKLNTLEPAKNQTDKIPVVNIQWAQRHPTLGYGEEISDSRQSFQANDYINNGYDFSYFESLLSAYLDNQSAEFMQITIGLEVGQEAVRFKDELEKQIGKVSELNKRKEAEVMAMSEFASWYASEYPGVSPSHFLKYGESLWYMSPKFRVAVFKENNEYILKDLRYYHSTPFSDYFYADNSPYLDRKVKPLIDNVQLKNEIVLGPAAKIEISESFDNLQFLLNNKKIKIDTNGLQINGEYIVKEQPIEETQLRNKLRAIMLSQLALNKMLAPFNEIKYSVIENKRIFGIKVSKVKLIGIKGKTPGIFEFEFQSLSKFKTIENITDKWQPWIN